MKTLKINFSLPLLVVALMAGLLLVGVNQAKAVVTFAQNTTLALGVGNITIEGGSSEVDEVTSTNTNITISMSADQTIVLLSSDQLLLSNSGGYGFTCEPTQSRLSITAAATQTVIVTPSSSTCGSSGGTAGTSGGGGGGGGGGITSTPTPTPTTTPTTSPAVSATPTPAPSTSSGQATPASRGFVNLESVSLNDGDVVSAAGSDDPDVYIVNPHGYKRLFLNPVIFGFYGHLGFDKVKGTTSATRDVFVTSGLFRNCETEDPKVYGVETTGEDTGMLHWVNTTGEQAVADDPEFFKKVFCINTNEFNWYPKGTDYASVNQIPDYTRGVFSASSSVPTPNQYKVVSSAGYLNVRVSASTASAVLGQLTAGDVVTSLAQDGVWHKITFEGQDAWVHGNYLEAI
ncbi:MAG: hypothetical protein A2655_02105 [Candidatus Yanofskybacteria bacterium RIFCSPHIGHO2_01_FULL_43_42]|uniref:SH3b domain-containing protein n=1 Tax=Candidatus Yanofskybacteria bacterium RIFCSPLOWO2_01_FULL_43_22 TaxID=1802695 RepID=A0A1F8GIY6_9BACT|nr:MAG: hypothetical protein A2655_02105 [Candidatus Yanofskybacteria bacterium RIFCSPHIGHO2_01_FULL_43_42]OGN13262.1 MAG: hypothetical protein A3D48_03010 [Candidatus Yanofskybacteria bacterium RIFCSPHIGHO2_02_FULL_43_17]OGN24678.1 MAG: hypothetical protein A3A13_01235 [Candidatus Yanofskybacteria bacterium RIFCSPLOWO2_01_FULL_43_22]